MKITNKLNMPKAIIEALDNDYQYQPHRYSVTELLNGTRQIILTRKYNDELTRDAADSITALIGTALHSIFEMHNEGNIINEFKMEIPVGIDTVVGKADYVDPDNLIIGDYKTTSVSKVMKNDFTDWEMQLRAYAYMYWKIYDKRIKECKIHCILKDWSKVKLSTSNGNYPASPYYEYSFKIVDSDLIEIEKFLNLKLREIRENEFKDDADIIECTDAEKWYSGTTWAVYKKEGDKKATKVFTNETDANLFSQEIGGFVVERRGQCLKCDLYCDCAKKCLRKE